MNHGFYQTPLSKKTSKKCVFHLHMGIHRMKRLFFRPMSSSGIFHRIVETQFRGLEGFVTIHDNILIHGINTEEHDRNLEAVLERARGDFQTREKHFLQTGGAVVWEDLQPDRDVV